MSVAIMIWAYTVALFAFVKGVNVCKPLYHFLFYRSMGGGVRLIGGREWWPDLPRNYPSITSWKESYFFQCSHQKRCHKPKEVGDAQIVGDNWKGCIMIPFLTFRKGYNSNLKFLQPLVPYHIRLSQWATQFGLVINYNSRYFETH